MAATPWYFGINPDEVEAAIVADHDPTRNRQLTIAELKRIRDEDPDGKETEPTDEDYRKFEAWVVQTYGSEALAQYFEHWDEGGVKHE